MEIEDLKRKVARLTEQVTKTSAMPPLRCLELIMENQITRWRHRLPELTDDDDDDDDDGDEGDSDEEASMLTAQAVYDYLGAFKGATRRHIDELRQVIMSLEAGQ